MEQIKEKSEFANIIKKNQQKKKNIFIAKIVSICLVFILVIIYFALPLSHVSNIHVSGLVYYTENNIRELAGLKKYDSLYFISSKEIKKNLEKTYFIEEDSVNVKINPFGLFISLKEIAPVFVYNNAIYLSNKKALDANIFTNENELIGEFAKVNSQKCTEILSDPESSIIPKSEYSILSSTLLRLSEYDRQLISYVDYDPTNYLYNFYYLIRDNTYLKLSVFNNVILIDAENLAFALTSDKVDSYKDMISDKDLKDQFVPYSETLNNEECTIYGEKLICRKNDDGTLSYQGKIYNLDSEE